MDDKSRILDISVSDSEGLVRFTDSYASFTRIVNSLQRKYLELKEEFTAQNEKLVAANKKLVELNRRNLLATEFLNGILDSISGGVIAVDVSGRVTHFNPAAVSILDTSADQTLGRQYRDIVPPGQPIDANALRAVETGREVNSVQKQIDLADGRRLQLSVSTSIMRDSEGRPNGAVEVFQDLTRIKKMEQELARLNTLAALGEMAATVAHEVRNPLSGIGGFAALLERDINDNDPKKKLVKKISRGVESLNNTVETLLNYTRYEEVNASKVDYQEFLNATIDQFTIDNSHRMDDFQIDLQPFEAALPGPLWLSIDRMLLRQTFFNVFSNAIDACDEDGRLELSVTVLPQEIARSRYSDRLLLDMNETVVETTITDNGPGVPQENIDKIFAPFFTTRREGSGLGLAVAWKIARAHGGDIFVENLDNAAGARFTLLIPTQTDNVYMERKQ